MPQPAESLDVMRPQATRLNEDLLCLLNLALCQECLSEGENGFRVLRVDPDGLSGDPGGEIVLPHPLQEP